MQPSCTKHQEQHKKLIPGCMLYWCIKCRKCRHFNIMADAESPRTVFETLYTRFPEPPPSFCFDNGCNVYNYMLNREPAYFQHMEIFIDKMHFEGHKNCSRCFSTDESWQTSSCYGSCIYYQALISNSWCWARASLLMHGLVSDTQSYHLLQKTLQHRQQYHGFCRLYLKGKVFHWTTEPDACWSIISICGMVGSSFLLSWCQSITLPDVFLYALCLSFAGEYKHRHNSPLAEQKNALLDKLRAQAAYMKQTTFLWYMRYFLVLQNRYEDMLPFWHESNKRIKCSS